MNININDIKKIAIEAWIEIMKIYDTDFTYEIKKDTTPLTLADKVSNECIVSFLWKQYPNIPIISEENKEIPYENRRNWECFWLIDPLDWTKEFINRNWEFTVNIALIQNHYPVLWVIYVPEKETLYYAEKWNWAYKEIDNKKIKLWEKKEIDKFKIVWSKSHKAEVDIDYMKSIDTKWKQIEYLSVWSSLKFCMLAEWNADIYPRLVPTMERDTWAWQIIASECWKYTYRFDNNEILDYNKKILRNPYFIVK